MGSSNETNLLSPANFGSWMVFDIPIGISKGKQYYLSVRTRTIVATLSWLGRNGFALRDTLIASLAKSVIELPVSEEEDLMDFSFLLTLGNTLNGVEVTEEQLKDKRKLQRCL
ncbi:hypothetical protein ACFE04_023986 [Oxalis oulophora]